MSLNLRQRQTQLLLSIVIVAILIGGVLAVSLNSTQSTASPAPRAVLRWANEGISDLYTLDPAQGPDFNSRQAIQLIYGGLVRFGPGFRVMPDAASHWQISKDGRTYTFHLRPNVRFADGRALTAADVAYSFNRTIRLHGQDTSFLDNIAGAWTADHHRPVAAPGIRVLNTNTIRVQLVHPDGSFLAKLANPDGYLVPRWAIQANPRHWTEHAFGTGPFQVSRWVHNDSLLLVPNPHYYGGELRVTGIVMPFISEPLAAYKQYLAGAIDTMGSVHFPTDALYNVRSRPDFHASARLETIFLTLNERKPPLDDERVRLALAHAIDKPALVRDAWNNFAHPTDAMMPPGLPGYNPAIRGAGYDPALARQLLAQAGFPNGHRFPTITYPVDQDAQSVVLANALAGQWEHVLGIHVRTIQCSHSRYLALLSQLKYQIAVIDWTADFPDPSNFVSQQLRSDSANNNGGWKNPQFDRLTALADNMPSSDPRRFALYREAEQIAMAQAATIPLVNPNGGLLLRRDIHGMSIGGGYLLVRDWSKVTIGHGGTS